MKIPDGIKQLSSAAGEAISNIRTSSGKTNDPDLMRYESLNEQDFADMEESFGPDNVFQYIKDMEIKRMSERNRR